MLINLKIIFFKIKSTIRDAHIFSASGMQVKYVLHQSLINQVCQIQGINIDKKV